MPSRPGPHVVNTIWMDGRWPGTEQLRRDRTPKNREMVPTGTGFQAWLCPNAPARGSRTSTVRRRTHDTMPSTGGIDTNSTSHASSLASPPNSRHGIDVFERVARISPVFQNQIAFCPCARGSAVLLGCLGLLHFQTSRDRKG